VTATEERFPGEDVPPVPAIDGPGARLRGAREAAGLSLDQVAQQLKLAPRQVKALEDENFAELPGRTFSRGFVRNYARLLNLDPEDLLLHLPDAATHLPSARRHCTRPPR
jgi:cytoskeleton protein RodZ